MCDGQSIFHESHRERRPLRFDPQRKTVCSTSSFGCPTASTEGAMRPILNNSSPALRQSALSMHSFMRARTPPGFADDDMTSAPDRALVEMKQEASCWPPHLPRPLLA